MVTLTVDQRWLLLHMGGREIVWALCSHGYQLDLFGEAS